MAIDLGDDPGGTPPTTAEKLQIRSAIGVGTTDAPTFLAQTLTGQSLTGTQATSLVDLSATWNTTGTPSAIKLNVTDTASNAASNLMDLQKGGVSQLRVDKNGLVSGNSTYASANFNGLNVTAGFYVNPYTGNIGLGPSTWLMWGASGTPLNNNGDVTLARDGTGIFGSGILAQRSGSNKQAFRVYNYFDGTTANEWFEIDWKTTANTVRLFTNHAGTGGARSMDISAGATLFLGAGSSSPIRMYSGGVERWNISATGHFLAALDNAYDIGASGANRPRNVHVSGSYLGVSGAANNAPSFSFANDSDSGMNGFADAYGAGVSLVCNGTSRLTVQDSFVNIKGVDLEVDTIAKGVILKSPDGTRYRVTAANGGTLSVTAV